MKAQIPANVLYVLMDTAAQSIRVANYRGSFDRDQRERALNMCLDALGEDEVSVREDPIANLMELAREDLSDQERLDRIVSHHGSSGQKLAHLLNRLEGQELPSDLEDLLKMLSLHEDATDDSSGADSG